MSTLLYLILLITGTVNEEQDWLNLCQLLALDTISFMLLLNWWQRRKR